MFNSGVVALACNPISQEAEPVGSQGPQPGLHQVQGQRRLYSDV